MEEMKFDEMRSQIAILKKKLNKQEIVNDRLLRETMRTKVNTINSVEVRCIFCAVLCILLYPQMRYFIRFSQVFCLVTCAMMLFCIIGTVYIHHPLHDRNLMSTDMKNVADVMSRFKHQYDMWLRYVTPTLLLPWITWVCYELVKTNPNADIPVAYIIAPPLIGCVIGGIIGLRWHKKAVNAAEDIIREIEE